MKGSIAPSTKNPGGFGSDSTGKDSAICKLLSAALVVSTQWYVAVVTLGEKCPLSLSPASNGDFDFLSTLKITSSGSKLHIPGSV